mmetsp:Transcript_3302/g.4652  ORF Transcript_3302/g.4652 Transcript_3302/m.4652 type:complete len:86 (-) Transcript_3302:69-326(-)
MEHAEATVLYVTKTNAVIVMTTALNLGIVVMTMPWFVHARSTQSQVLVMAAVGSNHPLEAAGVMKNVLSLVIVVRMHVKDAVTTA